jgi:trimethylamine--corrinoid protein Co-methyltransferase
MATIVAGGEEELQRRPLISISACPVSPLTHDERNTYTLMEFARHRLPVMMGVEAQAGATAPITIAGTLVQTNAESLSSLTIAQLTNPGTPLIYLCISTVTDMKTGSIALGAPELALIGAGAAQLAQYYRLPYVSPGGCTDSKAPDEQAAYEKAMSAILVTLAGGNTGFRHAGLIDSSLTASFEQLLIDDEFIGKMKRMLQGIVVNRETLATEVIREVGPGGTYLSHKHSRDYFRKEHFIPWLSDRRSHSSWLADGGRDLKEVARERAKQILATHQPVPLDKDVEKELRIVVKEAEKRALSRESPAH